MKWMVAQANKMPKDRRAESVVRSISDTPSQSGMYVQFPGNTLMLRSASTMFCPADLQLTSQKKPSI